MTAEEWREVHGWPDYRVSNLGRVASHKGAQPRMLSQVLVGRPGLEYPRVTLSGPGRRQLRSVHSLVAEAFIGPRPSGLDVRHLDGDRYNPRASNLRFGTRSENMQDSVAHGTHPMASKTHCLRNHEFTAQNTLLSGGKRYCRACRRDRQAAAGVSA